MGNTTSRAEPPYPYPDSIVSAIMRFDRRHRRLLTILSTHQHTHTSIASYLASFLLYYRQYHPRGTPSKLQMQHLLRVREELKFLRFRYEGLCKAVGKLYEEWENFQDALRVQIIEMRERGKFMERGVEKKFESLVERLAKLRKRVSCWRSDLKYTAVYCERCTLLWRDDGTRYRSDWCMLDSDDDEDVVGTFGGDEIGRKMKMMERKIEKIPKEEDEE